jgi:hypothetical protein
MRRIEHSAIIALSPNTRTSSPTSYRFPWPAAGYALSVTVVGGGR